MSNWLETYHASHLNPVNRRCHSLGIPLIVISVPLFFIRWRWGLGLFTVGWILQFIGHWFEGKPPAFFSDVRFLLVGPFWWVKKMFQRKK